MDFAPSGRAGRAYDESETLRMPLNDQINQRISRSALAPNQGFGPLNFPNTAAQGVFVANAWPEINASGIGRPTGSGSLAVEEAKVQFGLADFRRLASPPTGVGARYQPNRNTLEDVTAGYLEWGANRAKGTAFYSYCEGFTCATIAMLVGRNTPLPKNTPVEWFGMTPNGVTARGHAITVVNRDPGSNAADPSTWGVDCLIVDQWYALQTGGDAAVYANGPSRDDVFMNWLTATGNEIFRVAGFAALAYPSLNVPYAK
ncbi:hypothetical protein ACWD4V_21815 [Streptomyces tsukubensis]